MLLHQPEFHHMKDVVEWLFLRARFSTESYSWFPEHHYSNHQHYRHLTSDSRSRDASPVMYRKGFDAFEGFLASRTMYCIGQICSASHVRDAIVCTEVVLSRVAMIAYITFVVWLLCHGRILRLDSLFETFWCSKLRCSIVSWGRCGWGFTNGCDVRELLNRWFV